MNLNALLKLLAFHVVNQDKNIEQKTFPASINYSISDRTELGNSSPLSVIENNDNPDDMNTSNSLAMETKAPEREKDSKQGFNINQLMPYDCSMQFPPMLTSESPSLQPQIMDAKVEVQPDEMPHAEASMRIPLHIVHKLPESEIIDLRR